MIDTAIQAAVWALLLGGVFFAVVGGIGLIRLPDLFSRMHGSGMTDTLGAGMILGGLALHAGADLVTVKLVAALFFLLVTSPTSTHALSRAALAQGVRPWVAEREDRSSNS
jgi:multicomponent Na+:H+ antiporter subunit G